VALAILNFMVLPNAPQIDFELVHITAAPVQDPGTVLCAPANWDLVGTDCYAFAASPFVLRNVQNQTGGIDTSFFLTLDGLAWFDSTPGQKSTWSATLGGSIVGKTIGDNLKAINGTPGFVDTSIQGSVTVTALPEPNPTLAIGSGLCLLALLTRRFVAR
jgi:hypothetical protein